MPINTFRATPILAGVLLALGAGPERGAAQSIADWTEPFPPFKIAANLYYVGSKGLANYLITTPKGHILINSDLEANVPMIQSSIEALGFKFNDVKILLISHAHWDHNAGSSLIKQQTGAQYLVMDADAPVVESGGKSDFQYGNLPGALYPATKVDRVLHDGDEVKLGGVVLVARLTPGHTKGTTTWTMKVTEAGKVRDVVIVGSPNVNPGYRLVGNAQYPRRRGFPRCQCTKSIHRHRLPDRRVRRGRVHRPDSGREARRSGPTREMTRAGLWTDRSHLLSPTSASRVRFYLAIDLACLRTSGS